MAHHVGMSLLSLSNVLQDGRLRRRFLRDGDMRRAQSLLQEGIPTDVYIYRHRPSFRTPTVRERVEQQKREITDASPLSQTPRATPDWILEPRRNDGLSRILTFGLPGNGDCAVS